jgi:hypothetical protein
MEILLSRLSVQLGVGLEELRMLSCEVKLPWCGVSCGGCKGLCWNEGLYTQCGRSCSEEYCSECSKKVGSSSWLGSVSDRMLCEIGSYVVSGRREVSYLKIMKKYGITREMAERCAEAEGKRIPEKHFEERCRGRPRQKKESVREEPKRGRGRPRKEKTVKSNDEGEELIASLIKAEEGEEEEKEVEEEEEEIEVKKIEINGKTYLMSKKDNVLYDFVSHEEIGKWNENEEKIE